MRSRPADLFSSTVLVDGEFLYVCTSNGVDQNWADHKYPRPVRVPNPFHLADQAGALHDLTVMLQKEVVARMTAEPATPEYGRLTVMLQVTFAIERLFTVPPGAFRPPPTVDSAVARLVPLGSAAPPIADRARFTRVVTAAFGQRRKTLRNALADVVPAAAFEAGRSRP